MGKNNAPDGKGGARQSPPPTMEVSLGSVPEDIQPERSIGINQRSESKTPLQECVILRRDHTIAFRGYAKSREMLFDRAIRQYRGSDKGSLFRNLVLDGFEFHSFDVRSIDLSGSSMRGLKAIEMRGNATTDLSGCDMTDARARMFGSNIAMRNINLENAVIDGSSLDRPDMRDARMVRTSACEVNLTNPIMTRVVGSMGKFCRSSIVSPDLTGAVFIGSDFAGMRLTANELVARPGGALEYLNDCSSSQHSNCTVMSCNYSKNTVIEGGFGPFRSDRRVSRAIKGTVAFAAAAATSLVVETAVKKMGLEGYTEHLTESHYMPMAVSIIAGMAFVRETASDEMKGAFKANLDKGWSFLRKQARAAMHGGMDIYRTVFALGSERDMRAFNIALMADGKKSGALQIIKSILPGRKPLHVTICDRESAAKAVEYLTRQYHRIGDGKKMTIVMPENSGDVKVPTSMTLLADGRYTATWFDESSGRPRREISVYYDRFGNPLEAYDANGASLDTPEIEAIGAGSGKTIIKNMVDKIVKSPDFSDKVAFDIAGSYLDRTSDGAIAIRSIRTGKISNGFGPALYNANGSGNALYYKGGNLVTSQEGMATVEKNFSLRDSLDDIVGTRLTSAPATFPVYGQTLPLPPAPAAMPNPAFAAVPALPEPERGLPSVSPVQSNDMSLVPVAPTPEPAKPSAGSSGPGF